MPVTPDPHWRARLIEISDRLLVVATVEEVIGVVQQLVVVLQDEWGQRSQSAALQLVREAFDLLNDPESRVDRRDWSREAKKLLAGESS